MERESGAAGPPTQALRLAPPWLPGGLSDAEQVGRGASGEVWRAWQPQFQRWIALKVLGAALSTQAEEAFRRECRAVGGLSGHPFVVPVYDAGVLPDGRPYLVMPFLAGGSLADNLSRTGPLDVAESLDVGVKIASALAAAHAAGVLHRDVKPENVLLSQYREPQLADFGISLGLTDTLTRTGIFAATPLHAAPEVLAGQRASVASDVYGLGSTLFRLLAGRAAFLEESDEVVYPLLARIATSPPPDLAGLGLGVPAAVADLVAATMAKDPAGRPASAAALGGALQGLQAHLGLRVTVAPGLADGTPSWSGTPAQSATWPGASPGSLAETWHPAPAAPATATAAVTAAGAVRVPIGPGWAEPPRRRRTGLLLAGAAVALLLVAAGVTAAVLLSRGGGSRAATQTAADSVTPAAASPNGTTSAAPLPGIGPPTDPLGSGQAAPAPRGQPAPSPAGAGPRLPHRLPDGRLVVRVVDSGMGNPAITHSGPSTNTAVYDNGVKIPIGDTVTVVCATYGEQVTTKNATSTLWEFTDRGWMTDVRLDTGSHSPVVPACTGTVATPMAGSGRPDARVGPFPLLADMPVQVRDGAGAADPAVRTLADGTFVTVRCWVEGQHVDPIARFPGAHGSSQWDRLSDGSGWVPDVYVNSASDAATAPPC